MLISLKNRRFIEMKHLKYLLCITLATSTLSAIDSKAELELKSVIKMGEKGSKLLIKTLASNMKKSLAKGGTLQTFDFCSEEAYKLTQKVNKRLPKGVHLKRISKKYRSPANAPQENESKILKQFEEMKNLNVLLPSYLVEKVDTHKYKYYKALVIKKKLCLKCHGNIKDTDIKQKIAKRYPLDKATHYQMGDVRGAIVVTIDKSLK